MSNVIYLIHLSIDKTNTHFDEKTVSKLDYESAEYDNKDHYFKEVVVYNHEYATTYLMKIGRKR